MQATWSDRFRGLKDTPAVLLLIVGITGLSWAVFGYGDEHSTLMSADSVSSILDTHNQGGGREIHSLSELTESEKMEAWWAFLAACERATTVESVRIYSRAIGQLIGIVCLVAGDCGSGESIIARERCPSGSLPTTCDARRWRRTR